MQTHHVQASLREMVAPACLVILSPLLAGTFFGVQAELAARIC